MKPYSHMNGLNVAVLTPYKAALQPDGTQTVAVDCTAIPNYAHFLSSNGAKGVFVCGTTGDFTLLSAAERLQIQDAWLEPSVRDMFEHVIVHVGTPVWDDLVKLGRHASERGASAVAVTFPSFAHHAPQTQEHLIEYLAQVSQALPEIPLMLYNIHNATPPEFLNNLLPVLTKAEESNRIPTFVGVKYTSTNFIDAYELVTQLKLDVGIGVDEKFLPACAMGFKHFIGATYSIFCKKYVDLHDLFNNGHVIQAQKLATRLFEATRMLFTEGYFKLTLRYAANRLMVEKYGTNLGTETKFVFLSKQDDKSAEKLTERLFTEYSDLL